MINYNMALSQFELFILVLMRIATFIYVAPFFNTANTPQRMKIGFSLVLAVIVYQLYPDATVAYDNVVEYATIVVKEAVVGLLLGAVSSFCIQIIHFAGRIIDMDMGLSMANLYDPTTRVQVGIVGNLYYYCLMLLLIISGLHRYLISAIVDSYTVVPLGKVGFNIGLYNSVIKFISDYFIIGFRIALPVFAAVLLLNCILAILARIAPQMNMFVVGIQLKIFTGIAVLMITVIMLPSVSNYIFVEIKELMVKMIGGFV